MPPIYKWPVVLPQLDTSSTCWQRLERVFVALDKLVADHVAWVDQNGGMINDAEAYSQPRGQWPRERPEVTDIQGIVLCLALFESRLKKYAALLKKEDWDDLAEGCLHALQLALENFTDCRLYIRDDPLMAGDFMKMAMHNWDRY